MAKNDPALDAGKKLTATIEAAAKKIHLEEEVEMDRRVERRMEQLNKKVARALGLRVKRRRRKKAKNGRKKRRGRKAKAK